MYLVTRADAMLYSLLSTGATGAALPTTTQIYNTSVPELGTVRYPIVEFHETGTIPIVCGDGGLVKGGADLEYLIQAYSDTDDFGQIEPVMDAIETDLLSLDEGVVVSGIRYTLQEMLAEGHEKEPLDQAGNLYVRGFSRWVIFAEVV